MVETVATPEEAATLLPAGGRVLLLGGTAEAAALAGLLVARGCDVTTSLAGRTREPAPVAGGLRIGGFGGAQGLADWAAAHGVTVIVDATHPFAQTISANAGAASALAGIRLIRLERPRWQPQPGDDWREAASIEAARDLIAPGARVLLALGRQHIAPFAGRDDVHFIIRMVDAGEGLPAFASHTVLAGKPGSVEEEKALLAGHRIDAIVCRNSGGQAAYAKIAAARDLGLPVIMIA